MCKLFQLIPITLFLFISCNKKEVGVNPVSKDAKIVVVLGSSTAFGAGANPIDSSWVNRLSGKFRLDKKNIKVVNLAGGGFTTYQIMPSSFQPPAGRPERVNERNIDRALALNPDFIVINLPSNDIANGYDDNEILNNYQIITTEILKKRIRFFVTSTQPRTLPQYEGRKRLFTFNNKLANLIPNNIINYYSLLVDTSSFNLLPQFNAGDGIHLNNKGHLLVYQEILKDNRISLALGY
jgi:acyl-CoA thioesterase-1